MKTDILDSQEFYNLMQKYRHVPKEYPDEVQFVYTMIKEFIRQEYQVNTPTITIDSNAIRFCLKEGGNNFFFDNLFTGNSQPDWQTKVMRAIKKAYDECVRSSKTDDEEDVDNEDE